MSLTEKEKKDLLIWISELEERLAETTTAIKDFFVCDNPEVRRRLLERIASEDMFWSERPVLSIGSLNQEVNG